MTALQTGYQFTGAIPYYVVGTLVVSSIILELGPVLTGLILAGRIGARYAAELGTMRVTEQIDALESLGRSPASHLVIPRVLAGLIMIPALTVLANLSGVLSGWISVKAVLPVTDADFIYGAQYYWRPWDAYYSIIKAFFFAGSITVIACYMGFNTQQGAEGVGRSTTTAVVTSSVLILVLDTVLTGCCSTNDRAPRPAQGIRETGGPGPGRLRSARGRDRRVDGPFRHRQERLLKHIIGLIKPDSGTVMWMARTEHAQAEGASEMRSHIGYVFQNGALFDSMTCSRTFAWEVTDEANTPISILPGADHRVPPLVNLSPRRREVPGAALRRDAETGGIARAIAGRRSTCCTTSPPPASTRSTRTSSTAWCNASITSWGSPASW